MEKQYIVSMNCAICSLFQFSIFFNLHTFYKPKNIKPKPSTKVKSYFQI